MTVAFVVLGFVVLGLGIGFIATATAPMGYQDETGFHFGQEEMSSQDQAASYPVPQPRPI